MAHLDGWEKDNEQFAVSDIKAARKSPQSREMKWLVDFRGCAQELDLWIADGQMNDLLRAEARTRIAEVLAEDERMMLLKAATAANRAQHRGRQRAAALGAACYPGCRTPVGGLAIQCLLLHLLHSRLVPGMTSTLPLPAPSCCGCYTDDVLRFVRVAVTKVAQVPCYLRLKLPLLS